MSNYITVDDHEIELTHLEKELFPQQHITKGQLIDYYFRVAPYMLPHVKNRIVSMQRFPQGIDHEGFFHKNTPEYFPSWIKTKRLTRQHDNERVEYPVINSTATLIYLANQNCITPHIWLSTIENMHNPDRMIFDLDPSGDAKFQLVRWVAYKIRTLLNNLGLPSFLMLTGSRGVHIVVPLKPVHSFDEVRAFAHNIALELEGEYPKYMTLEMYKKNRGDRIFLDIIRNSYGHTTVAPYSVRPKPGAPIATPIEWSELSRVVSQKYTIKNIFRRLSQKGDIWSDIHKYAVTLRSPKR